MDTNFEAGRDGRIYQGELHEEPVAELVREAGVEIERLIRTEMAVAKRELRDSTNQAVRSGIIFGAGAVVALLGLMAITAFGIAALALAIPVWASALIIGGFYVLVAGAAFYFGREKLKHVEVEQLKHHLQEDKQWLKTTVERMKTSRENANA